MTRRLENPFGQIILIIVSILETTETHYKNHNFLITQLHED